MKQYDKIWVPSSFEEANSTVHAGGSFLATTAKELSNCIVCTLEELKSIFNNVWQEAQLSVDKDNGFDMQDAEQDGPITSSAEDFLKTYLAHKGIQL